MGKRKAANAEGVVTRGKLHITRDPQMYAEAVPPRVVPYKRIAGIDLGTNCGVAFCDVIPGRKLDTALVVAGQWNLAIGPFDSGPLRHVRLKQFLAILAADCIVYENVKYTPPQATVAARGYKMAGVLARVATSSEFLGGLKTTLTTWCEERQIATHGVAITAIKQWATGLGNASKTAMILAANARCGLSLDPEDYEHTGVDNIADAACCCAMGVEWYAEGLADNDSV